MRTVLVGSDFTFNKLGNLVPIEINTNVGWHKSKLEDDLDSIDLTGLSEFIISNGFTKVVYVGGMAKILQTVKLMVESLNIEFQGEYTSVSAISIPIIEDNDTTLIIRSAYDATAIVDDIYCRDKIGFLNLIKYETFGSQFAYKNELGNLVNNISTINDNGEHPNFILKSILPGYNKSEYPKLFRVTTLEELNIVLTNVDETYFLMEYHYNEEYLYNNSQVKIYRGLNLLVPPALESISLGGYTLLSNELLSDSITTIDLETFEVSPLYRGKYIVFEHAIQQPKLLDTDLVQLSDGTFKSALELQIGDLLKTIDVPNPNNIDLSLETADFGIGYEELLSNTVYSTNRVIGKKRVNTPTLNSILTFSDGTTWEDITSSFYLINRNNNIRFVKLSYNEKMYNEYNIQIGDNIILIDTSNDVLSFVSKEVVSITKNNTHFSGWLLDVERRHLFLTKTESTGNESFVSIEHNVESCLSSGCMDASFFCNQGNDCSKNCYCVSQTGTFDQPCAGGTNYETGGGGASCICTDTCLN
jgi:hypothetical protein